MFDMSDVFRITELTQEHEARGLEELLMSRPYGVDVQIGRRRAAFMGGQIRRTRGIQGFAHITKPRARSSETP